MKQLIQGMLLCFVFLFISCSPNENEALVSFQIEEESNQTFEKLEVDLTDIKWTTPIPPPTLAIIPVMGSLTLPLRNPLYTLRTEGVGTDFQDTEAIRHLLYQSLLEYRMSQNTYIPILAKRWSFSPLSNEPIYFELEESACWSDGSPVTAEDVVATFEFLRQKDLEQGEKTNFFNQLEATALSQHLVRVVMHEMDESSFYRLASQSIYPAKEISLHKAKDYLQNFNDKVFMGSGPYVLDEEHSLKEKKMSFLHKKDYWGRKLPYQRNLYNFEQITYRVIGDTKALEWSFREDYLDVLVVSSAKSWIEDWTVAKEPLLARGIFQKRKIINSIPHGVSGIAFNLRHPLLGNLKIREALAYLWNRQEVIDSLFFNEYLPTDSFYPSSVFQNPKNIKYSYNPAKALKILNDMGYHQSKQEHLLKDSYGNSINLELLITKRETAFFQQFSTDVKRIGINLKVTVLPSHAIQLRLINHDFDMAYTGFRGTLFPRPDLQFVSKLADDTNTLNIWGLQDPEIDQLLNDFVNKSYEEKRKIIQELDYQLSKKIIFLYSWHSPYANRIIYWNKFDQPLGLFGEYGNYFSIAKLWSLNPTLLDKVKRREDPSIYLPVGNDEIFSFSYYQNQL